MTTTTGGSGTEPFTAEIVEAKEGADYAGIFTVGDEVHNVTGFYNFTGDEGVVFTFVVPLEELGPSLSEPPFYGVTWSGPLTETTYSGGWDLIDETDVYVAAGTFTLERLP